MVTIEVETATGVKQWPVSEIADLWLIDGVFYVRRWNTTGTIQQAGYEILCDEREDLVRVMCERFGRELTPMEEFIEQLYLLPPTEEEIECQKLVEKITGD